MSVDYYTCEFCNEAMSEYDCSYQVVDGNEIPVCDYCIKDEIKKGTLIEIDKESSIYETLSDDDKRDIRNYGRIYRRTDSGKAKRLKEIDSQIEVLLKEKENLLNGISYEI